MDLEGRIAGSRRIMQICILTSHRLRNGKISKIVSGMQGTLISESIVLSNPGGRGRGRKANTFVSETHPLHGRPDHAAV